MSTELMSVNDLGRIAKAFALSNLFGFKNETEAFALMCIAQANGLHPAKAAERYHIIQGRPAMKSEAMLSAFQESGGAVKWLKRTDTECKLWLSHPQGGELEVTWNMERAQKAGLGSKDNWKKFPAQMLAARCVSEGVRALFPACLCGMYTPEEVADFSKAPTVEHTEAEVVDEQPAQSQAQAKPKAAKNEIDEDTKQFMDGMKGLWTQAPEIYQATMQEFGFKSANNVPSERRTEVFCTIQANITKAAQHQSAPTAMEQTEVQDV
jgi:hypothetical protein